MEHKNEKRDRSVTVFKPEPRHDIALTKLNVQSVLKFFDDIVQYNQKHRITLAAATLVSTWVRNQVIAKNPKLIRTNEEFFKLSLKELLFVIRVTVRPEHAIAFSKALEENVNMWTPDNYDLSVLNYRDFTLIFQSSVLCGSLSIS
jgi:hypothetical protein